MDFTLLLAPFEQLLHAPGCSLIILPISVVAYLIETQPRVPSSLVLPVSLLLGMILYPLLTPLSTVPATFPNPLIVLLLNGFILGFVAWLVHKMVVKRLVERFGPKDDIPPQKLDVQITLPTDVPKSTLPTDTQPKKP